MKISSGLFDNMVLQRDRKNLAQARFAGQCEDDGILCARINGGKTVECGTCKNGRFSGRLAELKTGGKYDIELLIKDRQGKFVATAKVKDVLVGDVWILGGQSNMEGIGHLQYAVKPRDKVRAFYMDDRWDVAKDPIHNIGQAVDQVHADLSGGKPPVRAPHVGVGPGVAFGQEMLRRTGVPQGLLSCAHGGACMKQWDPALKSRGGKSLYGAMLRRFHKNGGKVAGVLWYQGCADASVEHTLYTRRTVAFVKALRRDLGNPRLPVATVQIAGVHHPIWNPHFWNSIQEQQRLLPRKIKDLAVVPAVDLNCDDQIHISGFDQERLGKRLAQAMLVLRHEKGAGLPPIELESITQAIEKKTAMRLFTVKFRNVMGRLRAPGKPSGFDMIEDGKLTPRIFRTDLGKDTAILRTQLPGLPLRSLAIHYGYGLGPYCNITDAADRSLPVFGPALLEYQCLSDFVLNWQVSRAMPSAGKLHDLSYPRNKKTLQLKSRLFPGDFFCNLHSDLFACAPDDVLVYFVNRFDCAEAMNLELRLGYDGPIKAWLDGRQILHDPDGTPPGLPDKAIIPWKAAKGRHELVVALGSNNGRAWGLFARFRRKDVAPRLLKLGPAHYKLPVAITGNQA